MSSILEMIKSGKLYNLLIGESTKEIKTKIEEPDTIYDLGKGSESWGYLCGLELYFQNDSLNKITIQYDYINNKFKLPKSLNAPDDTQFDKLCSIDELINILDENEINWEVNKNLCDDTNICLSCNDVSYIFYCLNSHRILNIQCIPIDFSIEQNNFWAKKNNRDSY